MQEYFKSDRNPVFYIAEIGGNHEGNFGYAKKLTQLAISSGADAVKFQIYTGDTLVNKKIDPDRNKHFWNFTLTEEENLSLLETVKNSGLIPMASVWDIDAVSTYEEFLPIYKIGSGDLTHFQMIERLVATKKPIIISSGLSHMNDVNRAIDFVKKCDPDYLDLKKIAILHCVSAYPTDDKDANLNAIINLKKAFDLPIGYSDHTIGSEAIELAVSLGATIIEKHFTDSRENKSFRDHLVSIDAIEVSDSLKKMTRHKILRGDGSKTLSLTEVKNDNHRSFRRALYANQRIRKGELITKDKVVALRPLEGLSAEHYNLIIGKISTRDIQELDPFLDIDL